MTPDLAAKLRVILGLDADATEEQIKARVDELARMKRELLEVTEQGNADDALRVAAHMVKDAPRVRRETARLQRQIARIKRRVARNRRAVRAPARPMMRVFRAGRTRRSSARRSRAPAASSDGSPEPPSSRRHAVEVAL